MNASSCCPSFLFCFFNPPFQPQSFIPFFFAFPFLSMSVFLFGLIFIFEFQSIYIFYTLRFRNFINLIYPLITSHITNMTPITTVDDLLIVIAYIALLIAITVGGPTFIPTTGSTLSSSATSPLPLVYVRLLVIGQCHDRHRGHHCHRQWRS